jgi:5-formyltetrahydrofolate cyclo-ligase
MNPSRAELRQTYKQRRAALPAEIRGAAIARIVAHLNSARLLLGKTTIAAFMATDTEVDLRAWIRDRWVGHDHILLPRVADQRAMTFHTYAAATQLTLNRYGIAEPADSTPVAPSAIEAVLVPLVAFDNLGTRLGMGGGYYDRYLPRLNVQTPVIGVAYACQESEAPLPRDTWDVPLHAVVTENGVLEFSSS